MSEPTMAVTIPEPMAVVGVSQSVYDKQVAFREQLTAAMPQLIALKSFPYNGQARKPGDRFEASQRAAKIFKSVGKAKDGDATPTAAPTTENRAVESGRSTGTGLFSSGETAPPQRGGRHRRRDMRAED